MNRIWVRPSVEWYRSVSGGGIGGTLGLFTPQSHRLQAALRLSEPCTPSQESRGRAIKNRNKFAVNWRGPGPCSSPGSLPRAVLSFALLVLCVSSKPGGHADLLCIVPIFSDDHGRRVMPPGLYPASPTSQPIGSVYLVLAYLLYGRIDAFGKSQFLFCACHT